MIDWILHRPPHLSNQSKIRVAELLRGLADSPYPWAYSGHITIRTPAALAGHRQRSRKLDSPMAGPPQAGDWELVTWLVVMDAKQESI
jgi:hypothetical protein